MGTTQRTLESISSHLAESMGVRDQPPRITLSPVPSPKDIGRRPAKRFGKVDIEQLISDPDQPRGGTDAASLSLLPKTSAVTVSFIRCTSAGPTTRRSG